MKSLLILTCVPILGTGQVATNVLSDLQNMLYSEREWVKVHAAEFLLWENQVVDEVRICKKNTRVPLQDNLRID